MSSTKSMIQKVCSLHAKHIVNLTKYKILWYSIQIIMDKKERYWLHISLTKPLMKLSFFHRIIFSQKYDDVVFSFKLITKISKIQIAVVGKYFIKKYFLKEEEEALSETVFFFKKWNMLFSSGVFFRYLVWPLFS